MRAWWDGPPTGWRTTTAAWSCYHRVADPHWVVNHALTYGAEAEILEPEEMRALVREAVERMVG